jgi:hypothetical protein
MTTADIVASIDAEIAKLQTARAALTGSAQGRAVSGGTEKPSKKRTLSAEARAKISAAQKRRWAKQKRSIK